MAPRPTDTTYGGGGIYQPGDEPGQPSGGNYADRATSDPVPNPDAPETASLPVKFDPSAFKTESPIIGPNEMRTRIRDRLLPKRSNSPIGRRMDDVSGEAERAADKLAQLIVDTIPADMLTVDVARGLDLRPYAQQLSVADTATETQRQEAAKMLATLQDAIISEVSDSGVIPEGTSVDVLNQTLGNVQGFDPGKAGVSPGREFELGGQAVEDAPMVQVVDPVTGEITEQPASVEGSWNDYMPTLQEQGVTVAIPVDKQWLSDVKIGAADINTLIHAEGEGDAVPGVVMAGPTEEWHDQANPAAAARASYQTLKPSAARDYLWDLDEDDVEILQNQMLRGGFYDLSKGKPTLGAAYDEQTVAAWEKVLTESVKRGVPVDQLLQGEMARLDKQTADDKFGKFQMTEAFTKANELAVSLLGRELTPEEFHTVSQAMLTLRKERAEDVIGLDETPWLNQETAASGFSGDEFERAVKDELSGEMATENARGVFAAINKRRGATDENFVKHSLPAEWADSSY